LKTGCKVLDNGSFDSVEEGSKVYGNKDENLVSESRDDVELIKGIKALE
jgi:hypothetical protein